MNEKELDQLLEIDEKENITFDTSLRKKINKKIYIRCIIVTIVVCLVVVGGYFGTSCFLDFINYDPYQEEGILEYDSDTELNHNFDLLMQTYIEMTYPGKVYLTIGDLENPNIKSSGFSNYTISAKIQDRFEPLYTDGQSNTTFTISHSKLTNIETNENHALSFIIGEFKDPQNKEFQAIMTLEDVENELNDLPDSTVLDVSISFKDYQSLNEIIQYIKKYPNSTFIWLALKDQSHSIAEGVSGGMSIFDNTLYELTSEAKEKYPNFYLDENLTEENLKENYLSRLQLLIDHPDFIKLLSTYYGQNISLEILKEQYSQAQKEMKGYGLRVCTNKKDLLSMLKNNDLSSIYINNLKLSQYQQ